MSLSFLLNTAGYVCRPSAGGAVFLASIDELHSGCILLDLRMPEIDGMQVIEALGARIADFPVIVMTGHGDIATAVRAMKLGARDYIEKPFANELLLETLERSFETLEDGLSAREETASAVARIGRLTPRENDVLQGLATGLSNKIIAYRLNLSTRTVEMHRASLMDRLAVKSLSEAVRLTFVAGRSGRSCASDQVR